MDTKKKLRCREYHSCGMDCTFFRLVADEEDDFTSGLGFLAASGKKA